MNYISDSEYKHAMSVFTKHLNSDVYETDNVEAIQEFELP